MSTYMLNQIIYRDIEMIVIKFKSFLEKPYYAVHNFCLKKKSKLTHSISHWIKEDPLSILAFATLDKRYIVTGLYTHNSEQLHFLSRYRGILLLDCSLFVVDGFVFLRNSNGLPLVVNPDLVFMTLQIVNLISL